MSSSDSEKMTKKDRREHLREVARERREEELKRKKRNRVITQVSIVVGSLAILVVAALVIANVVRTSNLPGPANMASDGIVFTSGADGGISVVRTEGVPAGGTPTATTPDPDKQNIVVYLDYICPYCEQFETANIDGLRDMVASGQATLEIHPVAALDRASAGSKYSTRSAAAMACVANYQPDSFLDASAALFAAAPQEGTRGPKNSELAKTIADAGVSSSEVASCISDQTFVNYIGEAYDRAATGPIPNSKVEKLTGTPLVLVDGVQYSPTTGGSWSDSTAFMQWVATQAENKG